MIIGGSTTNWKDYPSGTKKKFSNGCRVGEYTNENDGNGTVGYIRTSPCCENPQWILWFTKKGDALLYVERKPSGAVVRGANQVEG